MFKRSTKITSLLVAAASVISMVPAMAADVKKVDSEEGKMFEIRAFKDGSFYVDGEVDGNDGAAYLYSDGKYKELDNVDSGDDVSLYGEKYLNVDDGDYYVDLTSGKVTDDDMADDDKDDAASALRKKLNKDDPKDRYVSTDYDALKDNDPDTIVVKGNKFTEDYYCMTYDASAPATDYVNGGARTFKVFTDKEGKYIDADYNLGKIQVKVTSASVEGNIKNTTDDDNGLTASITQDRVLGQDANYIYRTAYLKVALNNVDVTADATFGGEGYSVESKTTNGILVVQKISKAQASDDVSDAKYAKSVTTYFVTGDKGGKEKSLFNNCVINNGKIITFDDNNGGVQAKAITLKSNHGYNYTDFSDGIDESSDVDAFDTDVDGNLWVLQNGYVKKFDNDEDLDKIYKVDGSMSHLSVYDKDNIAVWDEDDEVYALIGGKSEETPVEPETPAVTAGWNQAADGTYTYVNADGTKATGWFQSPASGKWFYMDPTTGVMQTGWVQSPASGKWFYMNPSNGDMMTGWVAVNGTWYYMNPSNGDMQTGWIADGDNWYYCDASGAMLSNTTVDGYVLGSNGAWVR